MQKQITLFLFILCSATVNAQNNDPENNRHERRESIMALKVGMITEKINLSSEQAEEFWPIYNAYSNEKRSINRSIRSELKQSSTTDVSDSERLKSQDEVLELKEKEIAITKSYRAKLLKVITAKQYADLQIAEENFNRMLLQELRKRRERSNN